MDLLNGTKIEKSSSRNAKPKGLAFVVIKLSARKYEIGKSCNRFLCDSKVPKYHPKISN